MSNIPISLIYRLVTLNFNYSVAFTDSFLSTASRNRKISTDYKQIAKNPELISGLLWDRIIVRLDTGSDRIIYGIKKSYSETIIRNLTEQIGNFHVSRIESSYNQIFVSYKRFKGLFNGNNYVRHSSVERWVIENKELISKLDNEIAISFLSEKQKSNIDKFIEIYTNSHAIRAKKNKEFVEKELGSFRSFFDEIENNPLTKSQRLACVINEDNNLVLAGAGSGKTSVIIAKAGYLIEAKLAAPHEILILAYGRKASKETEERIKLKLPHVTGVTASTFHKLGLTIIGEATEKKPRLSKLEDDPAEFYSFINNVITELSKENVSYNQRIIDYFVTHLTPYEDEFAYEHQGDYFSALKERDIRSLKSRVEWAQKRSKKISLKQEQLRSFEEVVIADFLFVNGIKYIYEHPYEIDTANPNTSQYLPDFFLPDYNIYIEHFGIDREGKTPPSVDQYSYNQGIEWKRNIHRKHGTTLIETFSYEMKEGVLTDMLHSKLERHGVRFAPLSFDDLVSLLIKIGEEKKATQFTKLIVTFLNLFKQSGYSFDALRKHADVHPDKPRCHAFLDVFQPIYDEYSKELNRTNTVDFSDMIGKAIEIVQEGKYIHNFKYILVDEFQDISAIRAKLVKSLIEQNENTVLTCVGDDWQSIYRFTGSDIRYTSNFEEYFGYTKRTALDKTFRFNDKINEFATKFITQNPSQIKKQVTSHRTVPTNAITLVKYYQDVDRAIQLCVDDIATISPDSGTIYILGRYSFSKPTFLKNASTEYPHYNFLFDTIHGSKGKEADFVILVDVNDETYGFPSKIADEPLLDLVLPKAEEHDHAEERRLFYVAVTRAEHHSYILYDIEKPSVFINEICNNRNGYQFNEIATEGVKYSSPDFGTCPICGTGKVAMRVMNDGNFFFGCGNYPFCQYTPKTCTSCNKYPMIKEGNLYKCQNPMCDNVARACRQCSDGMMLLRQGPYGKFYGCSNFGKLNCRYTEKYVN